MQIPKSIALFETTLTTKLTASGTSFNLTSSINKAGNQLAGLYGIIVDEGSSVEEFMLGTVAAGVVTILYRGIDPESPNTEVVALKFEHARGASVKITDYPLIGVIAKILNGDERLENVIGYKTHPASFSQDGDLVDKKYVSDVVAGGVGTASKSTAGTNKMTHDANTKPRAISTLVREQDAPDMTLKVNDFKLSVMDKNISYAGGNSPAFINPGLGGDLAINTQPANGETITITVNGTACVFTAVTTIGSTPGNFLIGADKNATRANLVALINAPGTTNANQVAFTGAQLTAIGYLSATDDLSLNAFIRVINSIVTTFSVVETLAGAGNTWTVNTTKHRIDLLVYDTGGSALAIRKGVEAASPAAPTPTSGDVVLAQLYCRVGMASLKDVDDTTNGYVIAWYFPQIYRTDIALNTSPKFKFGGTGADGALVISSGTTTVDLGGAAIKVLNYSSISITGTGVLAFSNPAAGGTIVMIKCQGDAIISSSANPAIDLRNLGGNYGNGQASGGGNPGAGGGGGSSSIANGSAGTTKNAGNTSGADGTGFGAWITAVVQTGGQAGQGGGTGGTGGVSPLFTQNFAKYAKLYLLPGSGGGGGANGWSGSSGTAGGNGGRGAGSLFMEVAGAFTCSSVINAGGSVGIQGGSGAGSGGSGGGGSIIILYNSLVANTGTYTVAGGTSTAGNGTGGAGGAGANGFSYVGLNTEF